MSLSIAWLYCLAQVPEGSVADHLQYSGTIWHWDIEFSRPFQDWELVAVSSFMELLYSCSIRWGSPDSLRWRQSHRKPFTVRSYYSILMQPTHSPFPWRCVWKSKVPSRVAFFIWTAALGKIVTVDNLRKRRAIIIDWCCMCKSNGENVNHLLLHCSVAQELWMLVFALFGISWVMPRDVRLIIMLA